MSVLWGSSENKATKQQEQKTVQRDDEMITEEKVMIGFFCMTASVITLFFLSVYREFI